MKGNLYSVSDKAMFDALNQSKVTNPDLKDLFLSRGIIFSSETKRKDLAIYFSLFTHSYHDYKCLADLLGTNSRRERNTTTTVNHDIERSVLEAVLDTVAIDIEKQGAKCVIDFNEKDSVFTLKIDYDEFNYSNSEFKQVTRKQANIVIDLSCDGLVIRHPQNRTVNDWKAQLVSGIELELEEEVSTTDISLSHVVDHTLVTKFFTDIINDIDGYKLYDVTDVYVYHPKEDESDPEAEDESETEVQLGTHISKAALKGQNVLQSEVLKEFYDKGFYISKVIWRAKVDGKFDEDIFEFEVQFSDAENKDYFSYLAKGFYTYKGDGMYTKNRKALTTSEERRLNRLIESAAQRAFSAKGG